MWFLIFQQTIMANFEAIYGKLVLKVVLQVIKEVRYPFRGRLEKNPDI